MVIPDVSGASGNFPFVTNNAACGDLTVLANAVINVRDTLSISGDVINSGSIDDQPGGASYPRLAFAGSSPQDLSGALSFGGVVAVEGGATLNTYGLLTIENGGILLHGAGTTGGSGIVSGAITYQRQGTNSPIEYDFWSSPVFGYSASNLGRFIYEYDPVQATNAQNLIDGWQPTGSNMTAGKGYVSTAGQLQSFTGVAHEGLVSTSIATGDQNYNCVGNPYPGPIDYMAFMALNGPAGANAINGTIGLWDDDLSAGNGYASSDYVLYNMAGYAGGGNGASFNGSIVGAQGFFVEATGLRSTIEFNNGMRTTGSNDYLFRQGDDIARFRLSINDGQYQKDMLLAFTDEASDGFDALYDGKIFPGLNSSMLLFSYLNNDNLLIQSFGELNADRVVQLGLNLPNGGTFELDATAIELLDPTTMVYLEDTKNGTFQNLRTNPSYTFTEVAGTDIQRFRLHFRPALAFEATAQACDGTLGSLEIEKPGSGSWSYELKDDQGNVVRNGNLNAPYHILSNLPAGLYELELSSDGYNTAKPILIEQDPSVDVAFTTDAFASVGQNIDLKDANYEHASTWTWDMGDGTVFTDIGHPVYSYADPGVYTITLEAQGGDCFDSHSQIVTVSDKTTGIDDLDESEKFWWTIEGNQITVHANRAGLVEYRLFDLNGKLLSAGSVSLNSDAISATGLAAGIYILEADKQQFMVPVE